MAHRQRRSPRLRAAIAAGVVAVAFVPALATAAPAKPCKRVLDALGDSGYPPVAAEPALDLESADLASDDVTLTAVFRVAKLERPIQTLANNPVYRFLFTVSGSADRFYLSSTGAYGQYDAGYLGASGPVSLGAVTGSLVWERNEVHVHAPLARFKPRVRIGRGSVLSGLRVVTQRSSVTSVPEPDPLVVDEATSPRTYVAGTPTCVRVGDYCAPPSKSFVGGTAKGEDGLDANVQISVAFVASGHKGGVGMDGCPVSGYGATVVLNPSAPAAGTPHSSSTKNTWRVEGLPANVVAIWVETYPRGPDGAVTKAKYGGTLRRRVPVNRGDIVVRLPVVCAAHGRTGSISGSVVDKAGRPVAVDRAVAWSEAPDSQRQILGWGVGSTHDTNKFDIPALAEGQRYSVWVSKTGQPAVKVFHVAVTACQATSVRAVKG